MAPAPGLFSAVCQGKGQGKAAIEILPLQLFLRELWKGDIVATK